MKVFLTDQKKHFPKHLLELKKINVTPYQKSHLKHKITQIIINCNFFDLSFDNFFNYQIFPANILTAYPQWREDKRTIRAGDTIIQQINIPPFKKLSQRLVVGVRIKEIFNSHDCKGFSYETLKGHVEKGISTFKIEPEGSHCIFTIETYSTPPGTFLKLFQPLLSLYQSYCTNKALKNVKHVLINSF